jgi:hypothetical protein
MAPTHITLILPSDEGISRNRSCNEWGGNFPPDDKKNSELLMISIALLLFLQLLHHPYLYKKKNKEKKKEKKKKKKKIIIFIRTWRKIPSPLITASVSTDAFI